MDKNKSKKRGVGFEQLAQQVFQAILDQELVQNIEVKHNVRLNGLATSHQIDVFWEFKVDEVRYQIVLEAKDWKGAVDQGQVLKLSAVLADLPGRPRGIIVSRFGFQAGARRLAAVKGILLYELRKPTDADLQNRVKALILTLTAHFPKAFNIHLEHDEDWRRSEALRRGLNEVPRLQLSLEPNETRLFDSNGKEIGMVRDVIHRLFPTDLQDMVPRRIRHEFSSPTFLETRIPSFPWLKLLGLEATVRSDKVEQDIVLDVEEFVLYILKETLTGAVLSLDHELKPRPSA